MLCEDFGRNGAGEEVGLRHVPCQTSQQGTVPRLGSEPPRLLNLHAGLLCAGTHSKDVNP